MNFEAFAPGPSAHKARPRTHPSARFRAALSFIGLSLFAGAASSAPESRVPWTSWAHTRPLSASAIGLIEDASERSRIVTGLLKDLEKADVVVYVSSSTPGVTTGPASYLTFISREAGVRYLMVRIDFFRLSPAERIAALGHELQHALEIAAAPEVRDAASLAGLYRRIGRESSAGHFESEEARDTGNRVRTHLDRVSP
ncbi:MAG: hypothetical protein ABI565_02535 [Vicinamibacteria bacterium]